MSIERIGRAIGWSIAAKVTSFSAGIATTMIVTRYLDPGEWGVLSITRTISSFAVVVIMLGLDNALLRYIPALRAREGLRNFLSIFRRLMLCQLVVWLALVALSRFGGSALNAFFSGRFEQFALYIQIAVGFAIFEIGLALASNFLQARYETKRLSIVVAVGNALSLALLILFLRLGWGIVGVLAATACANLFMGLLLASQARRFAGEPSAGEGAGGAAPALGAVLRFSLPFVATGILNQIVWRQSEVILLGHFRGAEEAGFFSLAYRNPQLLLEFVPLTIWPLVMAGMSEAYAKNAESLKRAVDLYYRLLYLLVIPVAAFGFAFSRPLVPILFTSKMLPAALLTQLFFVVFSYSFLYTPLSMAFYVIEKPWVNMLVFGGLAVANVGLDIALIPRWGIWGAFIPSSIVFIAAVVIFAGALRRYRPDVRIPFGFIGRCYVAAIPAGAVAIAANRVHSPWLVVALMPAAAALLYAGFRVMRIIGPEEKELMLRLPIPFKERIAALF